MTGRVLLETHIHTKEVSPCGWLFAGEVIAALHRLGYGAAVITDHFIPERYTSRPQRESFLLGYRNACAAGKALGITVLPGIEIRFKGKLEDFLVYGMEEEEILDCLPDDVCDRGLVAFHTLANEKGWMVYQAHPFRPKMLPANPADIDGMEIFNGNPRHNSQNRLAAGFATRHSLRAIVGSDIHRQGDAGAVGIMAPGDSLTPKGFAAWLKATPHPRAHYPEPPRDGIRYRVEAIPGHAALEALYHDARWSSYTSDMERALRGIEGSLRVATAWDDTTLVGIARAVGDCHTILYVQDILVLGTYQRRGIGRELTRRLLAPFQDVRQVVLITDDSVDTRGFYKACGFERIDAYGCVGYIRLK